MKSGWQWPVGIFIIYVLFVLSCLGALIYFSSQKVDLVTEDYYEESIRYENQIERIKRTKNLASAFIITNSRENDAIIVNYPIDFLNKEMEGFILMYRPSDSSLDFTLPISVNEEGNQSIRTDHLTDGLWRIKIVLSVEKLDYYHEALVTL